MRGHLHLGDKGHGGDQGGPPARSPSSISLLPMGATLGVFLPWWGGGAGAGCPSPLQDGHLGTHRSPMPPPQRKHLGEIQEGAWKWGVTPQHPPPPPSWVHPWVLPTFPKCSSCDTLLQDRCRAPDTRSPISVGTGGRAAGGGTGRLRRCRRRPVLGPAPAALPAGVRGAEEPPLSPALGLGAELTFFGVVVTPSTATYRPSSTRVKPRPTERELHRVDAVLGMRLALSGKTSPQI